MYLFFLYVFFLWLALQNLVLPWVYRQHLLAAEAVGILMAAKEAVLVVALSVFLPRLWKKDWRSLAADKFAVAYSALLTTYLFCGPWWFDGAATFALRLIS